MKFFKNRYMQVIYTYVYTFVVYL